MLEIPELHLHGFDGPMDVLLDLAERRRIDVAGMSVLALAEQVAAALEALVGRTSLEQRADWLILGARLVLLRSKLIFAGTPEDAAEAARDARAELRRLDDMSVLRAAADWLGARSQLGVDVFGRPGADDAPEAGFVENYMDFMEACLALLLGREAWPDEASDVYRPRGLRLWRVSDALARARLLLAGHPSGGELAAFLPAIPAGAADRDIKARAAVSATFVAALELARDGVVDLRQESPFAPMVITWSLRVANAVYSG